MDTRQILQGLLREVEERSASDLHIGAGHPAMLRILGVLEPSQNVSPLTAEQAHDIAHLVMPERIQQRFAEKMEVDFSFAVAGGGRYRVNVYSQRGTVNIALRVIPTQIPTIEQLGLPPVVKALAEERRGLILLTGTTGSGKSTTLAAILDQIT